MLNFLNAYLKDPLLKQKIIFYLNFRLLIYHIF